MKNINFLKDPQNNVILPMVLKLTFKHKGFNFGIVIEPKATHKWYTLVHLETGGKMPMHLPTNKTIKHFHQRSIEAIDTLINLNGFNLFSEVLNSYPTIN